MKCIDPARGLALLGPRHRGYKQRDHKDGKPAKNAIEALSNAFPGAFDFFEMAVSPASMLANGPYHAHRVGSLYQIIVPTRSRPTSSFACYI